ncbi:MAG: YihA family ribosome biogenesis GTP-binding protein [Bacteroidia bacterium]|nr:YihA family ribosome biogenesis GTP-binding protein [Bacteroidia bacterium]
MEIKASEFVSSYADTRKCPEPVLPEFAFIGRSNVGKSSLINMLVGKRKLAKTSNKPGKTQTINHFIIDDYWYLVDLPGYGYASVSRKTRAGFGKMIEQYVRTRKNLNCLFILLDCRLEPQAIDLSFIAWVGQQNVPLCLVLTKADKISKNVLNKNIRLYRQTLLETWETLPHIIVSSATDRTGRSELLEFIGAALANTE